MNGYLRNLDWNLGLNDYACVGVLALDLSISYII